MIIVSKDECRGHFSWSPTIVPQSVRVATMSVCPVVLGDIESLEYLGIILL
jgi:hypothetical protein